MNWDIAALDAAIFVISVIVGFVLTKLGMMVSRPNHKRHTIRAEDIRRYLVEQHCEEVAKDVSDVPGEFVTFLRKIK